MKLMILASILAVGQAKPPATIPAEERGSAELNRVVSSSPRLDLFLNLPKKCDSAYDNLIAKLERCKSGEDNGHPSLDFGCYLHIDFESEEFQCRDYDDDDDDDDGDSTNEDFYDT